MTDPAPLSIRFGTDGVRGPVGVPPLTDAGLRTIGQGVATWAGGPRPRVLVGRDTRGSGEHLQAALVEGLLAGGAEVILLGVVPTAAVSCAVVGMKAAAGVMLTASHNPASDNGVKVVVSDGRKPGDAVGALESAFAAPRTRSGGTLASADDGAAHWRDAMPRLNLRGLTILLDGASGAGHFHAREVLSSMGASVVVRDPTPDGQNINDGFGALHPPSIDELAEAGAHLAVCLDGDADRIVVVDRVHGVLDGDDILWMLRDTGPGPLIGTVMSNGGLESALGGRLLRTPVGDQHVAAALETTTARVGAEPSGHVLFRDGLPTGDGLYTALRLLAAVADEDGAVRLPLPAHGWERWPVATDAVRFEGKRPDLDEVTEVRRAAAHGNRLVVRYSGTEPKLRILVEGQGSGDNAPAAWAARIRAQFQALIRE